MPDEFFFSPNRMNPLHHLLRYLARSSNSSTIIRTGHGIDLMVMGAYGHPKSRQFFMSGKTTKMIGSSK
jgi:hypothetical protein